MFKLLKVLLLLFFTTNTLFAISIVTKKENYLKGESIIVEVSGLPDTRNCDDDDDDDRYDSSKKKNDCSWVGLFYAYDKSKSKNLLACQYAGTDSSQTFTFDGLDDVAEYEARVFYKNNFKEKGYHPFKVNEEVQQEIQIKTQKEIYRTGEVISVDVTGMPGNQNDWLGIFYAFDENEPRHVVYKIETKGAREGTFTLPALDEAYEYEVRAFVNGSFYEEDYYPFEVIEGNEPGSVVISEVLAVNAHTIIDPDFSKFSDYVELYNSGNAAMNLGGYKLSDKVSEAKWTIPNGTILPARSYMIFWADDEDISLLEHHTNFKFKAKGEAVALFDPNGTLIDSIEFGKQKMDVSYAKNGFTQPTPMRDNWDIVEEFVQSRAPAVSKNGGFYNGAISISLSAQNGDKIYYTTDGSYPTYGSKLYAGAISIDKTTVLRAMSVRDGVFPSERITHTYMINEKTTLRAVSVTTDGAYLWDDMIGIYTKGINGISNVCEEGISNYSQDWKRPANIEFFDKDGNLGFSQEINLEISGNCSRTQAQKALGIKANDKYGKEEIEYKLFEGKDIDKFSRFKLRSSGQDWWRTMFRDAMIQQLIKDDLDVDYQEYHPTIVFLNGEYWGIYNIREYRNENFIASNYPDLSPKKIDVLYGSGEDMEIKNGSADNYLSMLSYIENNDLSDNGNYSNVAGRMDIANYTDYIIAQLYTSNYDWPNNNIRYWREQKDGEKWRWMMDDQDVGFNLFNEDNNFGLHYNMLTHATAEDSGNWRNPPASTFLFRNLLKNEGFKNSFVSRYNTLLDSTFAPTRVKALINQMKSELEPEMPRHIRTWGKGGLWEAAGADYTSMDDWNTHVDVMLDFADERPAIAKDHLNQMFP